jgi:hypothetical protein
MAVKPLDWVSWREARDRMPEIWDKWHFEPAHADQAMVNSLRRGNVPCRGKASLPRGLSRQPIALRDVLTGLLSLRNPWLPLSFGEAAEYEATEWRSVLAIGGHQAQPMTVKNIAMLEGVELAWGEFRDDLIRRELPAGVTPNDRRSGGHHKGRIPKPIWKAAEIEAKQWLDDNGCPEPGDGEQAKLERHIADWLALRGHHPAESTVRLHVGVWIGKFQAGLT